MGKGIIYLCATAYLIFCFTNPCLGQKFEVREMQFVENANGSANVVMGSGDLISRDSTRVAFQVYKNPDGEIEGYQLSKAGIMALKKGDKIPLHFICIQILGSFHRWYDNTNATLKRDDFGAWRETTINSVQESGKMLTVAFEGEVRLEDGRFIKQLDYDVNDDKLTPAKIKKYPKGPLDRFIMRKDEGFNVGSSNVSSWGIGEVISRDGFTVRFKAVAKDSGAFAGYKFSSTDLTSLKKGDQILLYFKSVKMKGNWDAGFFDPAGIKVKKMITGGWRGVTIKKISRMRSRIIVTIEENIETEKGEKVNCIEYQDDKKWATTL
jgi:hypothetical protein